MSKNDLPGTDAMRIAKEALYQFDPPLHEQAGVTEEQLATIIAIYIEEGALVPDGKGGLVIPPDMAHVVAAQPILAAMMLGKPAGTA